MPWMKLLAVDTTSPAGSLALLDGIELRGMVGISMRPGHAERLLPTLDRLLAELTLTLADIEVFAVACGPGSFTGLRIGISTIEGLSYATGRPVVGVSTLDATAHRFRHRPGYIASFLNARRGEIFGALYRSDGHHLETVIEPLCEGPDQFLTRLPPDPVIVAGHGTIAYRELLLKWHRTQLQLADPSFFLAEEVARIGQRLYREGKLARLGKLEAIYLRASDAEIARQQPRGTNHE